MPFEKVETQRVDFPAQERAVLEFWERIGTFERLRQKNHGKLKWSFLDGPITANNPMGVHHAWGRTYKDAYQRYFAMTGHEERYQNGFDCQGLWVEVEVEKELGLRSKRDIENLVPGDAFASIDQFVRLCKQRVDKFAKRQTEQSIRLGYWMDWDRGDDWAKPPDQRRSYFTMSDENNYTIWQFLKKCHERGLVYRGYDAMPWCPRCAVGLSQMEMHEGYQLVAHRAVFVRFPLRNRLPSPLGGEGSGVRGALLPSPLGGEGSGVRGENLLVWTTTPWTLTSNVAAAVNPQLTYLRVKHGDQVYYLAKGAFTAHRLEEQFKRKEWVEGVPKLKTLEQVFKEKGGYEVLGELSGAEIVGWQYDGPFDEFPAQANPAGYPPATAAVALQQGWTDQVPARLVHRVIAWDAVGEAEGTGIVHIAPGCGKEDFQLGKAEHLPPVAPLDELGAFQGGFGPLSGRSALDSATTDWILENLKGKGLLLAVEKYPHSYPHCWRCKTELLFRLVDEWFINMSWRDEIKEIVNQVTWLPEAINGKARELDWLTNMGDWMISKKRFWGLALPIWVCDQCGHFDVIGGREELRERAVRGWQEFDGHSPHRPWIDQVNIRCPKCGMEATRIPDVGNPWLDAGIVPFSTMGYNRDRAYWEKWFPADFITESFPGQFRNWFYAILAMSTMMEKRAPMKVLLGHGQVRDETGREMHKSLGNAIPFEEAAERMSADVMRWMFCRHNPANNLNFGYGPAEEIRSKFILKLWNSYAFFCNYARLDGFDPAALPVPVGKRPDIDRWILSDLQLLVRKAREEFERFNVMAFCLEAERFVDDKLSNWYIRRNRRRFWKEEKKGHKWAAYQTLYTVLVTLTKLLAPVMPFLAEAMYRNMRKPDDPESVHLCPFPEVDEGLVDVELSEDMEAVLRLISLASAARNRVKIKVRQPLRTMWVRPRDGKEGRALDDRYRPLIRDELNIKAVANWPSGPVRIKARLNMQRAGQRFGPRIKEVETCIGQQDASQLFDALQLRGASIQLQCPSAIVQLDPIDVIFFIDPLAPEGRWVTLVDRGTVIAIDPEVTPELRLEGMAREVVRHVQTLRKNAGLEMEDRIVLYLGTDSTELRKAVDTHWEPTGEGEPWLGIEGETLVVERATRPLTGDLHRATVNIDGEALVIELRKARPAGSP